VTVATPQAFSDLRAIGARFHIHGTFVEAHPYGSGHINDTFAATYDQAGVPVRYIHQRLNAFVFRDPDALMENVARVLAHAARKVEDQPHASRRTLTLVPARDGRGWLRDDEGRVWRTYLFIEGARTYDVIASVEQAEAAARAFGAFQAQLADLPAPRLHETIARFHHTRNRFDALVAAIEADACNRAAGARDDITFALAREADVDRLLDAQARGDIPERITHNDTKLNNVMLDLETGEGLCVIDLDTTMPGLVAYDFGDMVRTATNAAAEDEPDRSRVTSRPEMFDALARGFLATAGATLTPAEIETLAFGGTLMTLENGIRFLTDYLQGDVYYRTRREGQNLDRARVQFALVESLERQFDVNQQTVRRYGQG
jgi:aminoglycoside phosphotransferase (APT) family kinase protein